jgi:hypothetical protein
MAAASTAGHCSTGLLLLPLLLRPSGPTKSFQLPEDHNCCRPVVIKRWRGGGQGRQHSRTRFKRGQHI